MPVSDSQSLSAERHLSAEARALLAELQSPPLVPEPRQGDAAFIAAFHDDTSDDTIDESPIPVLLTAAYDDPKAAAFADMLTHLDDESGTPAIDEAAALRAAEKYKAEREKTASLSAPLMQSETDMATQAVFDVPPALSEAASDMVPASGDGDAEVNEGLTLDGGAAPDAPEALETLDALDDDLDFEIDETPGGLVGFFKRLSGGGRAVKRLVGVKDAAAAYDTQSGATLLPYTILRAIVLILVAAVPPIVNLAVIQPQISDNNRKITETLTFEARAKEDEKIADKLAASIGNVDKRTQILMQGLMEEEKLQPLVNHYVAALQRYGVALDSYNVTPDATRKVIVGDMVQDAVMVEMDLVSRYDVYTEIRKIFASQANKVTVVDELFEAQPGSVDLKVVSRLMVPVKRSYDAEVDKVQEGKK